MSSPVLTFPVLRRAVNSPEQRPAAVTPYYLVGPPRVINPITGASQPGPTEDGNAKMPYDPIIHNGIQITWPYNQPPSTAPTVPASPTPAPYSVPGYEIGTSPLETPAGGNVAPSTDPNAYIDPTTGQVVSPTAVMSITDTIGAWFQNNPVITLFLAGLVVYIGMEMFGKGGGGRRR